MSRFTNFSRERRRRLFAKRLKKKLFEKKLFTVSILFATITTLILRKNPIGYLRVDEFRILWILFVMMIVNAGLERSGALDFLGRKIGSFAKDTRMLSVFMILLTAIMAPFVTNDVALIVIVPLTVKIAKLSGFDPVWTIVFESVTANAASSLTPFGNPQNIYIYTHYKVHALEFMSITPWFVLLSVSIVILSVFFTRKKPMRVGLKKETLDGKWLIYLISLATMILSILKLMDVYVVGVIIVGYILIFERSLFKKVDYFLLGTFVAFFVFSGNIGSTPVLGSLKHLLSNGKNVFAASALLSQVTSNVPAAIILSKFTKNWRSLLLGTNVGGFGTIVASLANLIAFSVYRRNFDGKYMKKFHSYSLALFGFTALFFLFF